MRILLLIAAPFLLAKTLAYPDSECSIVTECQACPLDQLDTPACKPFGNRRLVRCKLITGSSSSSSSKRQEDDDLAPGQGDGINDENAIQTSQGLFDSPSPGMSDYEYPSWEPCTRVIAKERADFVEFVLCNSLFALVSLSLYFIRHRKIATRQYLRLATRIGLRLPQSIAGNRGQLSASQQQQ